MQLLALQSLFKLGHLPAVAAFLCDPTPLQAQLATALAPLAALRRPRPLGHSPALAAGSCRLLHPPSLHPPSLTSLTRSWPRSHRLSRRVLWQGILSLLHEERAPASPELRPLHRRLLSCCLQLLTLLLASNAAATHLEAFSPLPELLDRLEATTPIGPVSSGICVFAFTGLWAPYPLAGLFAGLPVDPFVNFGNAGRILTTLCGSWLRRCVRGSKSIAAAAWHHSMVAEGKPTVSCHNSEACSVHACRVGCRA